MQAMIGSQCYVNHLPCVDQGGSVTILNQSTPLWGERARPLPGECVRPLGQAEAVPHADTEGKGALHKNEALS